MIEQESFSKDCSKSGENYGKSKSDCLRAVPLLTGGGGHDTAKG